MNKPKMPTRGDRGAPKFIGVPDELPRFFDDVERVAKGVGLSDREMMMWACRYTQRITDEETWKTARAFGASDGTWEMFKKDVYRMYPELIGKRPMDEEEKATFLREKLMWDRVEQIASRLKGYPFEGYPTQTSSKDLIPRVYTQGIERTPSPPKRNESKLDGKDTASRVDVDVEVESKKEGAEDYGSPPRPPFQFRHIAQCPRKDQVVTETKSTQQSKSTSNRTGSLSQKLRREGSRSVSTPERPSPLEKPRREGHSQGPASPQSPTHTSQRLGPHRKDEERAGGPGTTSMPVSPVPSPKVHSCINERARVQRQHARNFKSTRTVEFKVTETTPANDSVEAQDTVIHTDASPDETDPNGAPPQPGPNDTSTAILRPKKSPNRLVMDEASDGIDPIVPKEEKSEEGRENRADLKPLTLMDGLKARSNVKRKANTHQQNTIEQIGRAHV